MSPAGLVSGKVVDPSGRPLAKAMVMLLGAMKGEPTQSWPVMGALTDTSGDYQVKSIPSGRYYLGAYIDLVRRDAQGTPTRALLCYYPGGVEQERAELITIRSGADTLALSPGAGEVSASLDTTGTGGERTMVLFAGDKIEQISGIDSAGKATFRGLRPGTYRVAGFREADSESYLLPDQARIWRARAAEVTVPLGGSVGITVNAFAPDEGVIRREPSRVNVDWEEVYEHSH